MVNISYIIGTHNEGKSIRTLVDLLLKEKDDSDEIIIVDNNSDDPETLSILSEYNQYVHKYTQKITDFSHYKNFKKSLAKGNFIFDLDGDEFPNPSLIKTIKEIIINNHEVDVYVVPRVNIVEGVTDEYVRQMHWNKDQDGFINWFDPQKRIYRNIPEIVWVNKVHETLQGYKTITVLPHQDESGKKVTDYSLLHLKSFEKQKQQNELYSKI
jgi:glycosyltransferase involved in cell wall biosynthesis